MLLTFGIFSLAIAAVMTADFVRLCRERGEWPWAGEVPVAVILILTAFGAAMLFGHFGKAIWASP